MGFLLHKFAHFVHALCLFKALRLFFLTNFPGPTVIPCPTSIPDSRVTENPLKLTPTYNPKYKCLRSIRMVSWQGLRNTWIVRQIMAAFLK